MSATNNVTVTASVSLYTLGYWLAFGAAYALHNSFWSAFWRGWLDWAYIGYLWAKHLG